MEDKSDFEKMDSYCQSLKKGRVQDFILVVAWNSFLAFLFFRASAGFDLTVELRLVLAAIFFMIIYFFNEYDNCSDYIKGKASLLALLYTKQIIQPDFDYRYCLNNKNMNAPLLMALEYKYGSASSYLRTIDYKIDSGFQFATYKDYFKKIVTDRLGHSAYSHEQMVKLDEAIIDVIDLLDVSKFRTDFMSRVRGVFFFEIARRIDQQRLRAYKDEDLVSILEGIKSELPVWSPFVCFIDATLLMMNPYSEDITMLKSTLQRISPELLAKSLSADVYDVTVTAFTPTESSTVEKLKKEYGQQASEAIELAKESEKYAKEVAALFESNAECKEYFFTLEDVAESLMKTNEAYISPELAMRYFKEYQRKSSSDELLDSMQYGDDDDGAVYDFMSWFNPSKSGANIILESILVEAFESLYHEFDCYYPDEEYEKVPSSGVLLHQSEFKECLIGNDSVYKIAKLSYKNFNDSAKEFLVNSKPTVHIELEDRSGFEAIHVSLICFFSGLGFFKLTASHALGLYATSFQGGYIDDEDELSDGMWQVSSNIISIDRKQYPKMEPERQLTQYEIEKNKLHQDIEIKIDSVVSLEAVNDASSISITDSPLMLLQKMAKGLISVTDEMIQQGKSDEYSIGQLLAVVDSVQLKEGYELVAQYSGNSHGGRTGCYARKDGEHVDLFDALNFSYCDNGALSAFWFHLMLPTFGVFWHGAYESDYRFLTSKEMLAVAIDDCGIKPDDSEALMLLEGHRVGFFIKNHDSHIDVSCLTFKPNTGIYTSTVRLGEDGRSTILKRDVLIVSKLWVLY